LLTVSFLHCPST